MIVCRNTQNLNEVAPAPVCSCSGAGTTTWKFCWRIPGDHSSLAKTMVYGQSQRGRPLQEKISLRALRLNLKKKSASGRAANGSSSAQSNRKAAKLCTPGHSKAICRNHSNANQIYSKWNDPLDLANAKN